MGMTKNSKLDDECVEACDWTLRPVDHPSKLGHLGAILTRGVGSASCHPMMRNTMFKAA